MVQDQLLQKIANTAQIEPGCKFGDVEKHDFSLCRHRQSQDILGRQEVMESHFSLSKDNLLLSNSALWETATALNKDSQHVYVISPTTVTKSN